MIMLQSHRTQEEQHKIINSNFHFIYQINFEDLILDCWY